MNGWAKHNMRQWIRVLRSPGLKKCRGSYRGECGAVCAIGAIPGIRYAAPNWFGVPDALNRMFGVDGHRLWIEVTHLSDRHDTFEPVARMLENRYLAGE